MGYSSRYELAFEPALTPEALETFRAAVQKRSDGYPFAIAGARMRMEESGTWYGYRDELAELSLTLPGVTIIAERSGEEAPDFERTYVRDGNHQSVKPSLVWPAKPEGF